VAAWCLGGKRCKRLRRADCEIKRLLFAGRKKLKVEEESNTKRRV